MAQEFFLSLAYECSSLYFGEVLEEEEGIGEERGKRRRLEVHFMSLVVHYFPMPVVSGGFFGLESEVLGGVEVGLYT